MRFTTLGILGLFLGSSANALAQSQPGFDVSRPGAGPRAVRIDAAGGVWVLETIPVTPFQPGLRIERFTSAGALVWTSPTTTLSTNDSYYSFAADPNGAHATAAYRNTNGQSGILRVDAAGSIAWHNSNWGLSGIAPQYLVDEIAVDTSGDSYVACATSGPPTSIDFVVLSFDAQGGLRWTRRIDGGNSVVDVPRDLALDGNGGLYVCGAWNAPVLAPLESGGFGLLRIDSTGNVLWTRSFAGAGGGGMASAVAVDAAGNALLAGTSTSRTEAWVVKYDLAGNQAWSRFHSIGIGAGYNDIAVDSGGRSFATGTQYDGATPIPNGDVLTDARDAAGNLLWHDVWSTEATGNEAGNHVSVDAGGRATVTGLRTTLNSISASIGRYTRDGEPRWRETITTQTHNIPAGAADGPSGNVVVALSAFTGSVGEARLLELRDQSHAFCFGDGSSAPCPCGNESSPGDFSGCRNSSGSGAELVDAGVASLGADTLTLWAGGMPAGTICLFVQGSVAGPAIPFGDGLRCAAGTLKRLYMLATPSGEIVVPPPASSPVSLRSAIEGDVLAAGSTRAYQVFYRDADPLFCPAPAGNTFDMSSGLTIVWAP